MNMRNFGHMPDGRECYAVTISDGNVTAEIITYGGAVRRLTVPSRRGGRVDVSCGFDTVDGYIAHDGHFGALIGRCGNRIGGASFELNGKRYELARNDGENHLHGGPGGFDRRLWTVKELKEDTVLLFLSSPDGEENYPGNLEAEVRYTVADSTLWIDYEAVSDADTLCNLTNHLYFNLNGHGNGTVLDQYIRLEADFFTPTDAGSIPTGEIRSVEDTPMDLRHTVSIGDHIDDRDDQLLFAGGYDHNWVLRDGGGEMRTAAAAYSGVTGILMETLTDRPGIQFYTGNYMGNGPVGKNGVRYERRGAFCLETQTYPDAVHHPEFPTAVLKAGERWKSRTGYRFSVK